MTHRLAASGLAKCFGERVALCNLSFEVADGEVFGFLGPNGAGKSTAFNILAGLVRADAGEIRFRGQPISPQDAKYRAQLGVLFQSPSVDLLLTGTENLSVGAKLYGLCGKDARTKIEEALARVGLAERAQDRVADYSGGMRRRLELARVWLHEPALLIMDEPGQGLDIATLRSLWEYLRSLADSRKMSIVVTTHSPEEAEFCDRLGVIDDGRLAITDTPNGLRRRIGGDVISVEAADGNATALANEISAKFGGETRVMNGSVLMERPNGHELIPRIVEAFSAGRLRAVSMRPPTLADAFAKLTGRSLA